MQSPYIHFAAAASENLAEQSCGKCCAELWKVFCGAVESVCFSEL